MRCRSADLATRTAASLMLAACAGGPPSGGAVTPQPERPPVIVTDSPPAQVPGPTVNPPPLQRRPIVPPHIAHQRGWLPRDATGTPAFLAEHPSWDGRGVLIGILDSGLDLGAGGLDSTSTGRPKVLDLRDFSDEGRIELSPVTARGDTLLVAGRGLAGLSRIRGLLTGQLYSGVFRERPLGEPRASDVNDNGTDADTLAIVVGKATDGWVLFADTDGDGSLADETPVRDFLEGRQTFGWHPAGSPPPLRVAANFREGPTAPRLDLFFDTSGHGTHVAGIAAGRSIAGITGFDGAAPGAQLLGLKIARNDFGGITTTGSMVHAIEYAIRFARERALPLVLNMSFGVGNAREGAARIDHLIDSVLAAHPDIVFVTSAGNDGPGLSTVGFPGSARRVISVGATEPASLSEAMIVTGRRSPDVMLYFSSRGGEVAKPDISVPGLAYSSVPRWDMGEEVKGGTSMASPHVAGLAAILVSAARAERREIRATDVRRALMESAEPVPGATRLDAGAGVPALARAWNILRTPAPAADYEVEVVGRAGATAAYQVAPAAADSIVRFRVIRRGGSGMAEVTLQSDADWVRAPKQVRIEGESTTIALIQRPPVRPGEHVATVKATMPGVIGAVFTLVSAVVVPDGSAGRPVRVAAPLRAGQSRRVLFAADSGRPFQVRVSTASARERVVAALHHPGGQPFPGDNAIPASFDTAAVQFDVDGRDARSGWYEAVATAPSGGQVLAEVTVDHAPVSLMLAEPGQDSVVATFRNLVDSTVSGRLRMGVLGAERRLDLSGTGGDDVRLPLRVPAWARRVVIDLSMPDELWPHFTDFGFTLLDAEGRVLEKEPVNYPSARLVAELPERTNADQVTLVLSPGFAEPGSRESWRTRISIRIEAAQATRIGAREGEEFSVRQRESRRFHGTRGELPWALPDHFTPLGLFLLESGGLIWTWEVQLRSP